MPASPSSPGGPQTPDARGSSGRPTAKHRCKKCWHWCKQHWDDTGLLLLYALAILAITNHLNAGAVPATAHNEGWLEQIISSTFVLAAVRLAAVIIILLGLAAVIRMVAQGDLPSRFGPLRFADGDSKVQKLFRSTRRLSRDRLEDLKTNTALLADEVKQKKELQGQLNQEREAHDRDLGALSEALDAANTMRTELIAVQTERDEVLGYVRAAERVSDKIKHWSLVEASDEDSRGSLE
jgi:hypothetical protein